VASLTPPSLTLSPKWGEGKLSSAVVLAALIGLVGAVSWRDGLPSDEYSGATGSAPSRVAFVRVSAGQPSSAQNLSDLQDLAALAATSGGLVTAKALTPTAPPVQLLIPALDVHRAVEAVGVNRSGVMDLPVNSWNAGWYKGGPVPGAPGDAVIEGHAGYPDQPMIFGRLSKLRPGDQIVVVLSDGSRRLFVVASSAILPVGSAPPGMAEPYGPPRLALVKCAGHFDKHTYSYSSRLVVEASYAGLA